MAEVYGWRSSSSVLCGLRQGPRPPCMTQFPLGYCWCTDFQSLTVVPSNSSWDLFCQTYYKVPCSVLRESPLISSLARPSESYRSRFYNEEAGDSGKLELTAQASLGLCCAPKVAVLPLPSGSLMNPKHGKRVWTRPTFLPQFPEGRKIWLLPFLFCLDSPYTRTILWSLPQSLILYTLKEIVEFRDSFLRTKAWLLNFKSLMLPKTFSVQPYWD